MVVISTAASVPINPSGASPILTREQVWAGLVIKCRQPQRFIPTMQDTTVVSHTADEIVRIVKFKPGMSPLGGDEDAHEVIKLTEGIKVSRSTQLDHPLQVASDHRARFHHVLTDLIQFPSINNPRPPCKQLRLTHARPTLQ